MDYFEDLIKKNKLNIEKYKIKSMSENSGVAFVTFVSHECVIETIENFHDIIDVTKGSPI